eukprot:5158023-Pleurochrysis_carterae.AAC.6
MIFCLHIQQHSVTRVARPVKCPIAQAVMNLMRGDYPLLGDHDHCRRQKLAQLRPSSTAISYGYCTCWKLRDALPAFACSKHCRLITATMPFLALLACGECEGEDQSAAC